MKAAQEALQEATDTKFELDKKHCVKEGSVEAQGNSGFGGLQGRFRAMARDTERTFSLKLSLHSYAGWEGAGKSFGVDIGVDVTGRTYAPPGARCVPSVNPTLGAVVAHEMFGHVFGVAYGSNARVAGGQEQAIVQQNRYHAARTQPLRDASCGD